MLLPNTPAAPEIDWVQAFLVGFVASMILRVARDATKAFIKGLRGER